MFCSQCGTEISDNANLCDHCGSPIIRNTQREISSNDDTPIPKSSTNQSMGKRVLIALCIILLIAGLFVFIFSFQKPEIDNPKSPVRPVVQPSPFEAVVPTPAANPVVLESPVEAVVPAPVAEPVVQPSPVKAVVPTPAAENVVTESSVEAAVPKPPVENADSNPIIEAVDSNAPVEPVGTTSPSNASD